MSQQHTVTGTERSSYGICYLRELRWIAWWRLFKFKCSFKFKCRVLKLSILFRDFHTVALGMAGARCKYEEVQSYHIACSPWQQMLKVIAFFYLHSSHYTLTNQCLGCLQCLDLMNHESHAQHVAMKHTGVEPHASPLMKFRPDPTCSQANPSAVMCGEDGVCSFLLSAASFTDWPNALISPLQLPQSWLSASRETTTGRLDFGSCSHCCWSYCFSKIGFGCLVACFLFGWWGFVWWFVPFFYYL